jgi:hypothetical protein
MPVKHGFVRYKAQDRQCLADGLNIIRKRCHGQHDAKSGEFADEGDLPALA